VRSAGSSIAAAHFDYARESVRKYGPDVVKIRVQDILENVLSQVTKGYMAAIV
jgi:hypothetical protein